MELGGIITLVVGLVAVSLIGLKALKSYNSTEVIKHSKEGEVAMIKNNHEQELQYQKLEYQRKIHLAQDNRNYYKTLHENYEMDYDKMNFDDNLEGEDEDFKLSDLAKTIYPKLPPSLSNLIDKEEFHNAILKTVEKKPDLLNTFIDKFISKPEAKASPQQVIESGYI